MSATDQHVETMSRAVPTQALKENRAGELMECLLEGGSATVDPIARQLILYPGQLLREQADPDLTDDEIADLRRRGYIAVKIPEIGTDEFADRVIEVPLSHEPHDKGRIRLDQGNTGTKLAITGFPSTLNIEHAPPFAAALLAAYEATTGHTPSQATWRFGPIGWTAGTYDGPGIITATEPTGTFARAIIEDLNNVPGEPLWVDYTAPEPHLHIDAQNGTWIYKLTNAGATYTAELVAQPDTTTQGAQ